MSDKQMQQILLQASEGLLYPSESDYPFEYINWGKATGDKLTTKQVREFTHQNDETPVQSVPIDNFFATVTEIKEWYGEEEKELADRFVELKNTLQKNLTHLQVFKVGEVEIDAYIIGKNEEGECEGLSTKVIET